MNSKRNIITGDEQQMGRKGNRLPVTKHPYFGRYVKVTKLKITAIWHVLSSRLLYKLVILFTSIIILVVTSLTVISYQMIRKESVKHSIESTANNLLLVNRNLQDYMDGIAQYSLPQLQYDDLIHAIMNEKQEYASRMYLENYLRRLYFGRSDLDGISLYIVQEQKYYSVSRESYNIASRSGYDQDIANQPWYNTVLHRTDNQYFQSLALTPADNSHLAQSDSFMAYHRVLRSIASRQPQAILTFYVNPSARDTILQDTSIDAGEHLIFTDANHIPFYVDDPLFYQSMLASGLIKQLQYQTSDPLTWTIDQQRYMVMYNTSTSNQWTLMKPILYSQIYEVANTTRNLSYLIGTGFLLISFALVTVLANEITRPLGHLSKQMNRFSSGEFEIEATVKGQDEIAHLTKHFNDMVRNTNELINERYRMKLVEQNAILKALEAELNPHFLYNALQAISTKALRSGRLDIADMVDNLAQTLRYCIGGKDIVMASEELKHIERYLSLQKARFGSRLQMTVHWDDSLLQLPIPKLSIQSLVENSIKHAVEQVSEPVMITITAHLTDQDVLITVRDNGPGISPDRLEQVLASFKQTFIEREGSHIGLQNLHTRLQILYGEQAGLLIASDKTGTELSMHIPQGGK
ncbi:sensor histidine kinase [Paenibacillus kyungheensis]